MAAQGGATAGADRTRAGEGRRRTGVSSELIAILAVGAMMAGTMLTMMNMMMGAFEQNFTSIREEIASVRREIRSNREEIASNRKEIASLREEVASNRREIASLRDDVGELRKDVRTLQAGQAELRERMVRLESKVDLLAGDWPGPARGTEG